MLFRHFLRKNIFYLFIYSAILFVSSSIWNQIPLIVPLPGSGFVDFTEIIAPVLLFISVPFMFYDSYEIELSLVCGVRTRKLFLSEFFVFVIYAMIPMIGMILGYQYTTYTGTDIIRIPIYIPENYKLYLIVSAFVTIFFFAAMALFLRVLTRNCYVSVGLSIFMYLLFKSKNETLHYGQMDIRLAVFDPFISNYLIGDTVTQGVFKNLWTTNRLLFFVLGLVLLGLSCIVLNREKQHENFSD